MTRFHLVPAFGLAAALIAAPSFAQARGWSAIDNAAYAADGRQPYYESRQRAYDNGYREGLEQGGKDGRSRKSYNFQDERTWRNADKGYNRSFGEVDRYRQQFRAGYERGYSDGYRRYGYQYGDGGRAVPRASYPDRYPGSYGYPSRGPTYGYPGGYGYPGSGRYPGASRYPGGYGSYGVDAAARNGFDDGIEKGREDADKRRSYDPLRHSWYRSGDHDYKKEYGAKEQYKDVYREAFKDGYDRGFSEYGYRR